MFYVIGVVVVVISDRRLFRAALITRARKVNVPYLCRVIKRGRATDD